MSEQEHSREVSLVDAGVAEADQIRAVLRDELAASGLEGTPLPLAEGDLLDAGAAAVWARLGIRARACQESGSVLAVIALPGGSIHLAGVRASHGAESLEHRAVRKPDGKAGG
jgi:hypothetical protein